MEFRNISNYNSHTRTENEEENDYDCVVDHCAEGQTTLVGLTEDEEVDDSQYESVKDHLDALVSVGEQEEDKVECSDHVLRQFQVRLGWNEEYKQELDTFVVEDEIGQMTVLVASDVEDETKNDTNLDDPPDDVDNRIEYFLIVIWARKKLVFYVHLSFGLQVFICWQP